MAFEGPAYLVGTLPHGGVNRNARVPEFVRSLVAVARDQQLTFLAAAIAYYAFVSVIPLLLVALAVASAVAGETLATEILSLVGEFVTPEAAAIIEAALVGGAGRGSATVVGLDIAFSRVYGSDVPISLLAQIRDALLVLGAMGVGLAATVTLGAILPLADIPLADYLGPLGLVFVLAVVFLPVYYVFPDCQLDPRDAVPGAVFAGVGWTALSIGFSAYAARATAFQLYGLLGAVLVVLTWFYFGGLLVLLGAALNAVLADRQLQQGGLRDTTQRMSNADRSPDGGPDGDSGADVATVESEPVDHEDIAELRRRLDRFEEEIDERTVHRDELESDLKGYVRQRFRRGHARGWGPYLVLLYGTIMTLGAFYFLSGGWAILAMLVVWLSTLGLYTLMVLVGATVSAAVVPRRMLGLLRKLR